VKHDRGAPPKGGAGRSFERGGFKKPFRKSPVDGATAGDGGARPAFRKTSSLAKPGGFAKKTGGYAKKPGGAGKSFGGKPFGSKPRAAGGKSFTSGKPFGKFGAKAGGKAGGGTPAWKKKSAGSPKKRESSGKGEAEAS
jgi:23S rRNA pseudouridine2605 synthase